MLTRCRQSGVTLIEMMIAIALIALLMLVALPNFSVWLANLRVRTVAESITSGLQLARIEATKRNASVRFHLDSATGGGWTVLVVDGGAVIESKAGSQGGTATVTLAPNSDESVGFSSLGQRIKPTAASGDMTVSITNPGSGDCQNAGGAVRCLNIQVPAGGQVRMCDPSRPDTDPQAC